MLYQTFAVNNYTVIPHNNWWTNLAINYHGFNNISYIVKKFKFHYHCKSESSLNTSGLITLETDLFIPQLISFGFWA